MQKQEMESERHPVIATLLADLASHHERLTAATEEFRAAIRAAQEAGSSLRHALGVEAQTVALGAEVPEAQAHVSEEEVHFEAITCEDFNLRSPRNLDSEGAAVLVPSEWHRRLMESPPRARVADVKQLVQVTDSDARQHAQVTDALPKSALRQSVDAVWNLKDGDEDSITDLVLQTTASRHVSDRSSELSDDPWDSHLSVVQKGAVDRMRKRLGKTTLRGDVEANQVYSALVKAGFYRFTPEEIGKWMHNTSRCHEEYYKNVVRRRSGPRLSLLSHDSNAMHKSISCKALGEALLDDEVLNLMPASLMCMSQTIREILFCGDANRLVAELTQVSMEEVVMPQERPDFVTRIEPFIGILIFLNGVYVGVQASMHAMDGGPGWFWGNTAFTSCMILEVAFRISCKGWWQYMHSWERWWNAFDALMIIIAMCDLILEASHVSKASWVPISGMRIFRLMRLARLVRIFRLGVLRELKELNVMIRGLFGGMRTLFWAVFLLFFFLYFIGVFLTTMVSTSDVFVSAEVTNDELFNSVPRSVLTSFRCFMGDCTTSGGKPVVKLMSDAYGLTFIMCYIASTLFLVFGFFNLVIAVYVENTMNAAKTEGAKTPEEREGDAIFIARQTRQLLKKFCTVKRVWTTACKSGERRAETVKAMRTFAIDDILDQTMEVSKDMYLCALQDSGVQKLMDDMDIPSDRVHLFDVLDADGSGDLEVSELITGLLRVRGEAKKSDILGTFLAVRTLQEMIRELADRLLDDVDPDDQGELELRGVPCRDSALSLTTSARLGHARRNFYSTKRSNATSVKLGMESSSMTQQMMFSGSKRFSNDDDKQSDPAGSKRANDFFSASKRMTDFFSAGTKRFT